jgi:hypothetical protein
MYEYLLFAGVGFSLEQLRAIADEFHEGSPLPETDKPKHAPITEGGALCLRYREVRGNIGLWFHVSTRPELQAHLFS